MERQDLIDRLEQAETGTRELSDAVLLALGWTHTPTMHWPWKDPLGWGYTFDNRPFPAGSVDDALALLPGGWICETSVGAGYRPRVYLIKETRIKCYAATLALALCAAILRATAVEEE